MRLYSASCVYLVERALFQRPQLMKGPVYERRTNSPRKPELLVLFLLLPMLLLLHMLLWDRLLPARRTDQGCLWQVLLT